jgi:hypothetical protein
MSPWLWQNSCGCQKSTEWISVNRQSDTAVRWRRVAQPNRSRPLALATHPSSLAFLKRLLSCSLEGNAIAILNWKLAKILFLAIPPTMDERLSRWCHSFAAGPSTTRARRPWHRDSVLRKAHEDAEACGPAKRCSCDALISTRRQLLRREGYRGDQISRCFSDKEEGKIEVHGSRDCDTKQMWQRTYACSNARCGLSTGK